MEAKQPTTIGIISQYFYPDPSATGRLLTDLATGLGTKGYAIVVYTGCPAFWQIKKRSEKKESYQGITINRVFSTQLDTRKKPGQFLNAFSFTISVFFTILFNKNIKLFFIVTNPPFLPFIGYLLKKIKKIEYITIVHDIEPNLSIVDGYLKQGWITDLWMKLNKLSYKNSSRITVLGRCMKETICEILPDYDPGKVEVIPNWEDETYIKPLLKEQNWFAQQHNFLDKFVVLYSGNMSVHHDLDCIIEAADLLRDKNIVFVFIGEGIKKETLKKKTQQLRLKNVLFLPFQPSEMFPYSITSGDVNIISQMKGSEGLCVSCKLYTALATGKPVIALIGKNSEISKTLTESNCGFAVDTYNPIDLAKTVESLVANERLTKQMGSNARTCFLESYTKNHAIDKYHNLVTEFKSPN